MNSQRKTDMPEAERRLAMLIDGDNAQHSLMEQLLEEASRYGAVTIRRAYGDWTEPNLAYWRPVMLSHAIQPIQQWRYTVGKNASDSALIIDAMDILYARTVQGFCVVSSDSDYTRLCTRIRESGLFVMGMGRKKTPEAFIKACDVFVYIENLIKPNDTAASAESEPNQDNKAQPSPLKIETLIRTNDAMQPAQGAAPSLSKVKPKKTTKTQAAQAAPAALTPAPLPPKSLANLTSLLHRAIDISEQEDGWTHLGALGNALHRLDPSFDSRTYGYKSLSLLVKALPKEFTVKETKTNGPSPIYIRTKK
jgi:hypothetical protein